MKLRTWIPMGVVLLATPGGAEPTLGGLTVVVTGLESDEGRVVIALLDSAETYASDESAYRSATPTPAGGEATVTFDAVEPGTYAVKVFHDVNENGKLDTNFVGIPKEPFGFSNNAMGRFGPPDFEKASFSVGAETTRIEIAVAEF